MFFATSSTFTWIIIAILIGLLLGNFLGGGKVDKSKYSALDKDEFVSTMRKGTLIDVRKKELFDNGKILGAKNYPKFSGCKSSAIRRDIPIFIYDEDGKCHNIAKKYVKNGAVMVYYLKGGYKNYKNEGQK